MIKLDDETKKKVDELRSKAVEEYFETCDSIVPGFVSFMTKKEIHLRHYHLTMHPGIFFVNIETINDPEKKNINVYYFSNLEFPENESGEEAQGRFELTAIQGKLFRNKKKQTIGLNQIQLYATADYLREHESEEEARKFLDTVFAFKPVEKPDTEVIELSKQDAYKPLEFIEPNTKLYHKINEVLENKKLELDVAGKAERKKGKEVKTLVEIPFDDESINLSPMAEYERQIVSSYLSLIEAGNKVFTDAQVWKVFANTDHMPTKEQEQQIYEMLNRQRFIPISIDFTQEMRKQVKVTIDDQEYTDFKIDSYLFPAIRISAKAKNGQVTGAWKCIAPPPLLLHAKMTNNKLINYEQKDLDIALNGIRKLPKNVVLARYLLNRVKRKDRETKRIQYEALYKAVELTPNAYRSDKARIRTTATKILDNLRKEKVIKKFCEYKANKAKTKAMTGFIIDV